MYSFESIFASGDHKIEPPIERSSLEKKSGDLRSAASNGDINLVRLLLEQKANPNPPYNPHRDESILSLAMPGLGLFYRKEIPDFKSTNQIIQALVTAGTEITPEDLVKAVETGNFDLVQFFVSKGATFTKPFTNYTLLAAKSGNVKLLDYLITSYGLPLLPSLESWRNPEHEMLRAAAQSGSISMMRYLEEHHLNLVGQVKHENDQEYAYEYNCWTTILGDAVKTNLEFVRYLFEEKKLTPPMKKALAMLKKDGAQFSGLRMNAYLGSKLAESKEDQSFLLFVSQKELKELDLPTLFKLYNYPLLRCHEFGNFNEEITKEIENRNVDLSTLTALSSKPETLNDMLFYYASFRYGFENKDPNFLMLKHLIEKCDGDVNAVNKEGASLSEFTFQQGGRFHKLVYYYIEKGATVDHADHEGRTLVNASLEFMKYSKDLTAALQYSCKDNYDHSLVKILEFTKGEIGHADPRALLQDSLVSRKVYDLLMNVSKSVYQVMKKAIFSFSDSFLKQYDITRGDLVRLVIAVESKRNFNTLGIILHTEKPKAAIARSSSLGHFSSKAKTTHTQSHDAHDQKPLPSLLRRSASFS